MKRSFFSSLFGLACAFAVACGGAGSVEDGSGGAPSAVGGTNPGSGGVSEPGGGSSSGGSAGGGASDGGSSSGGQSGGQSASGGGMNPGSGGRAAGGAGAEPGVGGMLGTGGGEPIDLGPHLNAIQWADTDGNPIQAHGGGMIEVDGYYYWFGENRNPDGTFLAVSVYRSRDLRSWEFRNDALKMTSDPDLRPANVERPKVVYNAQTKKYVMWMHWENGKDYGEARAAVASSDTVDGDYTYHGSKRPYRDRGVTDHGKPGYMSRDCTLFVDDDGQGYFLSTANENYDLHLYLLTPDYLEVDTLAAQLFVGGHREAPALFKRGDTYFLVTSGSTGWNPNQAKYATSMSLTSGWSELVNVGDGTTFYSQSTYVLPVTGSKGTSYLYMGDRWAGAYGGRVNDSSYVWLPIEFPSNKTMSLSWANTLEIDVPSGTITGKTNNFRLINDKSGLAVDVAGGSTEDGGDIVQTQVGGSESQEWSFNYNGSGYFRITSKKSGKVVDVPDESTADGIELSQWESNGGDHQAWLIQDQGGGLYKIRNKKSGKYVSVVGGSSAEGAALEQRSATDGPEQLFRIEIYR